MIVFRVDASQEIGAGHLMRCISLANALSNYEYRCRFVCRHIPEYLISKLLENGHEVVTLSEATEFQIDDLLHSSWLGASQYVDAEQTISAISDISADWIVVDHYALDKRWESLLRPHTSKMMVIDDLADRDHDCDLLLDQNHYSQLSERYVKRVPSKCALLLGPKYALLRNEFYEKRKLAKLRVTYTGRILVNFGGMDFNNLTEKVLEAIAELEIPSVQVDAVIGLQHKRKAVIEKICDRYNFNLHVQTHQMADLMLNADIAIGAGGIATWERCCLGLPSLVICTADNQADQIANAAEAGLIYSPSSSKDIKVVIKTHLYALIDNPSLRKMISSNSMKLIDGKGVQRVLKELGCLPNSQYKTEHLLLRVANTSDALVVWPWRNHATVRQYFFNSSPLNFTEHNQWWSESLINPNRILLIGELNGVEVGVLRYDVEQSNSAHVSIYLNPYMQGMGIGELMLKMGSEWLLLNRPEVNTLSAEILNENTSSLIAFKKAGFLEQYVVLKCGKFNHEH